MLLDHAHLLESFSTAFFGTQELPILPASLRVEVEFDTVAIALFDFDICLDRLRICL